MSGLSEKILEVCEAGSRIEFDYVGQRALRMRVSRKVDEGTAYVKETYISTHCIRDGQFDQLALELERASCAIDRALQPAESGTDEP